MQKGISLLSRLVMLLTSREKIQDDPTVRSCIFCTTSWYECRTTALMDELVRVGTCLVCDWIHGINCYGLCNSIYIVTVRVQSFSGRILRMLCARVKSNRYC
ncbi:unnamed protein product, partial [Sphacelaria rigidula]